MGLATFLRRALVLSINVTLRMFVMLMASVFGIFMLVSLLWDHPFGIFFVLALTFFPGLVFLYLSCVRAGLVALKASGPPNMKKLGTATIRLFRFNIMINNLIMTLVGIGGSVLLMKFMTPTLWMDLSQGFEIADLADLGEMFQSLIQMPLAVVLMLTLALSFSNGIIGTSSASVAANAAEVGPNHPSLWGVTRQFWPLFALSMLVLWLPALIVTQILGGALEPISNLGSLSGVFYLCLPIYMIWAGCAICGGKALAYVQTVQDLEQEWVKERDDMLGDIVPEDNLRSLRRERQEAGRKTDDEELPDGDHDVLETDTSDLGEEQDVLEPKAPEYDEPKVEAPTDSNTLVEVDAEPVEDVVVAGRPDDTSEFQTEEEFRQAVEKKMAEAAEAMAPEPKTKPKPKKKPKKKITKRIKTKIQSRRKPRAKAKK